jgi:hypothetical protein
LGSILDLSLAQNIANSLVCGSECLCLRHG